MTRLRSTPAPPVLSLAVDPQSRLITITTLRAEGVERLGTFTNPADAWAAIDVLDSAA